MARIYSAFAGALILGWPIFAAATDSTEVFQLSENNKQSMRQCCTTTIDRRKTVLIDCMSNSAWWSCPYPSYDNGGTYTGQFPCPPGYVLVNLSTYQKWNILYGRYQQMVRAAWCAPVKYNCFWIRAEQSCQN